MRIPITFLICVLTCATAFSADAKVSGPAMVKMKDDWFTSDEGRKILANIAGWQNPDGGWSKGYDAGVPRPDAKSGGNWDNVSTFDNSCTYSEMRLMAKAFALTGQPEYRDAFGRGLNFIFTSQYANGGWPQRFPLAKNYGHQITYNDNAMLGVMRILKDVIGGEGIFNLVTAEQQQKAKPAYQKGIECVLNTQVKVNGKRTVWCQQHDAETLVPASARAYELPSLTASESSGLVILLMEIEQPDDRVKAAIEGAAAWFDQAKILGKRVEGFKDADNLNDRRVIDDPAAPPLWARYYDLETGKPYFADRDGIKQDDIQKISRERRAGYAWYGNWGANVAKKYEEWKQRIGQ